MGVDRRTVFIMLAIVGSMTRSASALASAEEIYKSIDQAGKVTYSAAPLADAVATKTLKPPHQPTPEQVCAAEEQYQLVKNLGAELEKDRKQREQEQARIEVAPLAIVYQPVQVFAEPIHPLWLRHGRTHLKPEPMAHGQPRLSRR